MMTQNAWHSLSDAALTQMAGQAAQDAIAYGSAAINTAGSSLTTFGVRRVSGVGVGFGLVGTHQSVGDVLQAFVPGLATVNAARSAMQICALR